MKCICDGHVPFGLAGFEPGVTPLGVFRPPAPQDYQMRAAQLHQFASVQPTLDCLSCDPVAEAMRNFQGDLPAHTVVYWRRPGPVQDGLSFEEEPEEVKSSCNSITHWTYIVLLQWSMSRRSCGGRGSCRRRWRRCSPPRLRRPRSRPRCWPPSPACHQVREAVQ